MTGYEKPKMQVIDLAKLAVVLCCSCSADDDNPWAVD